MPNIFMEPHPPPSRDEIYRQIGVILEEGQFAAKSFNLLDGLRKRGIKFDTLVREEDLRLVAIRVEQGTDVSEVLNVVRESKFVEAAEQDRVLGPFQAVDDPLYPYQWALGRMGAEAAWRHVLATLDLRAPGVVVAILDTGVRVGHPDLAGHLWDDGSGHYGFNLLEGTFNVSDTDGHGTQLAGTIGAVTNNTKGIAVAEWPVRLMTVKFLDLLHPPTALTGAIAIWWAVVRGAQVITTAWGAPGPSQMLKVAIEFARLQNAVVVAAAGNDGVDNDRPDMLPTYPASYGGPPYNLNNVISVMASELVSVPHAADLDDKAPFSNYGKTRVHLAAPGVGVLTTDTHFAASPGRWKSYSGTSASCAHVAYAAAILKALNPGWTPVEIRDHLIASVDKSPWLECVAGGRLSLDRAVCGPFVITSPLAGDVWRVGTNPTVTWRNRYSTPTATKVKFLLSENGGAYYEIAKGKPNNGTSRVPAPTTPVARARLRIQSEQGQGLYADSGVFSVQ